MENGFSSRSNGKFPGATEHLKRMIHFSKAVFDTSFRGWQSFFSNGTDWEEIFLSWILPTICRFSHVKGKQPPNSNVKKKNNNNNNNNTKQQMNSGVSSK